MNNKFKNKNFLVGITGGVAIYKTCDLVRKIKHLNGNVVCVMTEAATKFISPMLFEQLSQNKVYYDMFDQYEYSPTHISLSDWADFVIVVPCSCNTLSKLATGKTEDLLTSTIYALDKNKKVFLCPSMNTNMWTHTITQKNLEILKKIGYKIIPPEKGSLLCNKNGIGKLPDVDNILKFISLQI
jgi:phosphopantothenoylcysteine decarboxylase/phosphopantothenate--cysteine ligase